MLRHNFEYYFKTLSNNSVLFKIALLLYVNYMCMTLASDSQDGNGLQLEKKAHHEIAPEAFLRITQ